MKIAIELNTKWHFNFSFLCMAKFIGYTSHSSFQCLLSNISWRIIEFQTHFWTIPFVIIIFSKCGTPCPFLLLFVVSLWKQNWHVCSIFFLNLIKWSLNFVQKNIFNLLESLDFRLSQLFVIYSNIHHMIFGISILFGSLYFYKIIQKMCFLIPW